MYPNLPHSLIYPDDCGDVNFSYSDESVLFPTSDSPADMWPFSSGAEMNELSTAFPRQSQTITSGGATSSSASTMSNLRRSSMDLTLPWSSSAYRGDSLGPDPDMHMPLYSRRYSSVRDDVGSPWTNNHPSLPPAVSPSEWSSMNDHPTFWDPALSVLGDFPDHEEKKPDVSHLEDLVSTSARLGARRPSTSHTAPAHGGSPSEGEPAKKSCSHCHATSTPLWRREPGTQRQLCNACGLYLQQRHKLRPQELIDADQEDAEADDDSSDGAKNGPECSHCHTRTTSVWRRNKAGDQVCNACGVYARLRKKDRPLSLRKNKIKPRAKHAATK